MVILEKCPLAVNPEGIFVVTSKDHLLIIDSLRE
jgi:hypothetical protein